MIIIGFCDGKEKNNDGSFTPGKKVYFTEKLPELEERFAYGNYAAVAFFPDKRNDGRKQIDNATLEGYIDEEIEVDIFFNNFGRNPVIIPRQ